MSRDTNRPRDRADEAARLYVEDRDQAEALARQVLADPDAATHADAIAVAHRVVALVNLNRGNPEIARGHIDAAVEAAQTAHEAELLGAVLLTRVGVRAVGGDPAGALDDAARAEALLEGELRSRAKVQRATVLGSVLGRVDDAIAAYDDALSGDRPLSLETEAAARNNRGIQLLRRGDYLQAMVDHRRSRAIQLQLGNQEAADEMALHIALAAARQYDLPTVFALHAEAAERGMFDSGDARSALDLSDALLIVGLDAEATELTERAASLARGAGNVAAELEAMVRRADLAVNGQQYADAQTFAGRAVELAATTANEAWAARATITLIAAERADGVQNRGQLGQMLEAIEVLDANGWASDATDTRLQAADLAIALGDCPAAAGLVAELARAPTDADFPARARFHHARALSHLAAANPGAARRQLAAALREADDVRRRSGAEDLRATGSDLVVQLADLGLRLAVANRRPRPILEWVERQRAASLRLALPERIEDPHHRAALDRLRTTDPLDTNEIAALERAIVQRARARRATTTDPTPSAGNAAEVVSALEHRTLVEYLVVQGRIHAIVARRGRVSFHPIDRERADVGELVHRLQFGLRRMAGTAGARAEAAAMMVDATAATLSELLLRPLLSVDDTDLVIVPSHELHQLPWSALKPVASRAAVVAPSADLWRTARLAGSKPAMAGLAVLAGPNLPDAEAELREIAASWPAGTVVVDPHAGVESTLGLLGSVAMAHIVTHGRVRHDNPLFSSLELDDGALMIYDLERVARMPAHVVLSACSLATVQVRRGDDILGFPAALFARGVQTLTASSLPVADTAARPLMVDYHRHLVGGHLPSHALAHAARSARERGLADRAAADSFMVLGFG